MIEQYSRVLRKYVPEAAVEQLAKWIIAYGVHLRITRERSSKLGDFRPGPSERGHRISVNHSLNQYSFLITLVHEIAHLETWNQYGNRVRPHGAEWKSSFRRHMMPFLNTEIFPDSVLGAVTAYLQNPAASSCVDENLMKELRKFDGEVTLILDDLPEEARFRLKSGRVFVKGPKRRKYYQCTELATSRPYLVNSLAEVEPV